MNSLRHKMIQSRVTAGSPPPVGGEGGSRQCMRKLLAGRNRSPHSGRAPAGEDLPEKSEGVRGLRAPWKRPRVPCLISTASRGAGSPFKLQTRPLIYRFSRELCPVPSGEKDAPGDAGIVGMGVG